MWRSCAVNTHYALLWGCKLQTPPAPRSDSNQPASWVGAVLECVCVCVCAVVYSSMADCSKYTVEEAGFDISALKTSLIQYFRCRSRPSGQCCCSLPPRIRELREREKTPQPRNISQVDGGGRGGCCCCCCVRSEISRKRERRRKKSAGSEVCVLREHFSCVCW